MAKRNVFLVTGAALLTSTVLLASSQFDFSKINQSIERAASNVVTQSKHVEEFKLMINAEETDIDAGKVSLSTSYVLKDLPWASEEAPSKWIGAEKARIQAELTEDGRELYKVNEEFEMKVAVLPMLHHYAENTIKMCSKMEPKGLETAFVIEGCAMAETLKNAQSLDDVASAFLGYKEGVMGRLDAFIVQAQQTIVPMDDTSLLRNTLQESLAEAQEARTSLSEFMVSSSDGQLEVNAKDLNLFGIFDLQEVSMVLTESSWSGQVAMTAESEIPIHELLKPEIKAFLKDLENDNEFAIRHLGAGLHVLWSIGEKMMQL